MTMEWKLTLVHPCSLQCWWTKRSLLPALPSKIYPDETLGSRVDENEEIQNPFAKITKNIEDSNLEKEINIALVYGILSPCFTYSSLQQYSPCHCIVHRILDVISREELKMNESNIKLSEY
ncbi:uncharacterized protein [Palaemon carinicauda]|uniref:uncharacterized protein isoform X2 n=1 Tax=Palaemon carinicauda TaxID=392227 RepID=UPI0035B5D85F